MKKTISKSKIISCALAGLCATTSVQMLAPSKAAAAKINCKGTATKWINDCSTRGSRNAKENFSQEAWLKMNSKDECLSIQKALENPTIKKYVERVQKETAKEVLKGRKI